MPLCRALITPLLFLLCVAAPAMSADRYSVELLLGGAVNASTPLTIDQAGEPEIEIDAEYATRPFEFPLYYTLRLARLDRRGAWELQFIHHKIYLKNTTGEIERFEITHGFNVFSVNRAFAVGPVDVRTGAGVVVGHTEARVRGLSSTGGGILDTGYELAGPALLVGCGRRFALSETWAVALDAQVTVGWADVSVAEGGARTTNVAFHAMIGIGYGW